MEMALGEGGLRLVVTICHLRLINEGIQNTLPQLRHNVHSVMLVKYTSLWPSK